MINGVERRAKVQQSQERDLALISSEQNVGCHPQQRCLCQVILAACGL